MVPKFNEMAFPILKFVSSKYAFTRQDIYGFLVDYYKFSQEDLGIKTNSGDTLYKNRAGWAISYLIGSSKVNGAIKRIKRGEYQITEFGMQLIKDENKFNEWFYDKTPTNQNLINDIQTPDENLEANIEEIHLEVKDEIISRILEREPRFFENLALELMKKIGYDVGGSSLTKNGADGGIDGIINEDLFGFSKIYIQAKRYDKSKIGRDTLQAFAGALSNKPTTKGLFITTSTFTKEAIEFSMEHQNYSIILIDKYRLTDLMLKYEVGVEVKEIKKIYKVDTDFFEQEI
ncbi:restriction endonuclease [Campylobacter fetus]|nr:restriction endonuclease [Campylobacter fetus]